MMIEAKDNCNMSLLYEMVIWTPKSQAKTLTTKSLFGPQSLKLNSNHKISNGINFNLQGHIIMFILWYNLF